MTWIVVSYGRYYTQQRRRPAWTDNPHEAKQFSKKSIAKGVQQLLRDNHIDSHLENLDMTSESRFVGHSDDLELVEHDNA